MKLKKISVIALIVGALTVVASLAYPIVMLNIRIAQKGPIAIIGGADMPIFRHLYMSCWSGWPMVITFLGAAVMLSALFCLIFNKTVK